MLENYENVEKIKLIDCPMYEEYSVIVLFKDGKTRVIDLDTSEEAIELYQMYMQEFNEFKKQNNQKTLSI